MIRTHSKKRPITSVNKGNENSTVPFSHSEGSSVSHETWTRDIDVMFTAKQSNRVSLSTEKSSPKD